MTSASPPDPAATGLFTPGYIRILGVQMAFGTSYSAFLLLPKFLKTELHASASEIGAMAGVALISAAVLAPVIGYLAGRFDRRRLLVFGLLLEASAAYGFVSVTHVGLFAYLLRFMQGLAFSIIFNCTATLVADQVPRHRLGRAVGYLGLAMLMTNALAPALTEPLAAAYGWDVAFIVSGTCALVALFVISRITVPAALVEAPTPGAPPSQAPIYYGGLLVGAGIGCLFTFVQPYALEQGAERVGDFFFGYVTAAFVARGVFAGIPDKYGPRRVAGIAMLLYSAVTVCGAFVTPATLGLLGAGLGLAHGFIYPSLSAAGLSVTPPEGRSAFMGWFGCAFNVGCAFATLTMGPVADASGYPIIFVMTGLWLLSGAPLLLARRRAIVSAS